MLRGYVALLVLSHIVRLVDAPLPPRADQSVARVHAVEGTQVLPRQVDFVYTDLRPDSRPDAPVLVLLHGSPMASLSMMGLAQALDDSFRVIVPDLPGMGRSTRRVPDYSIQAHALYLGNCSTHSASGKPTSSPTASAAGWPWKRMRKTPGASPPS